MDAGEARNTYRLLSYAGQDDKPRPGLLVDETVYDAGAALRYASGGKGRRLAGDSVLTILQDWRANKELLRSFAAEVRRRNNHYPPVTARPLAGLKLLAPILYPHGVYCAGANYRDHVEEMSRAMNLPSEPDPHSIGLKPWHFVKTSAAAIIGHRAPLRLPAYSKMVDWEAEIAVVIGVPARNVPVDRAMDHVAGYTIVNDVSARDHLKRDGVADNSPFKYDWISQKCFADSCPMGPWITPLEDVPDANDMDIKLWVNGEIMQDSNSRNLIFDMAEQVSHLSTRFTLLPGDVVVTGTPAGVGMARGRFLRAGDEVKVWVEGIGELVNRAVAA